MKKFGLQVLITDNSGHFERIDEIYPVPESLELNGI
jgi:hypothetical protein